ncbi:hypothetical protein ASE49_11225 [Novosphingobium sp. Leaf2]|nr:hypothetical protein ASE49_11225 [Novosphingobium sp. Leaf2]
MQSMLAAPIAAAAILVPAVAQAHPGHALAAYPLLSGVLHPLTGTDHLAAMVLVGMWSGTLPGKSRWAPPAAFVGAMVAGFGLALSGAGLGGFTGSAEWGIVLSVLVLGCIVALRLRASLATACAVTGAFGMAHGMAHGLEAPGQGLANFAAGFIASTAVLHILGVQIARRMPSGWVRGLGVAGAALGVMLAAG